MRMKACVIFLIIIICNTVFSAGQEQERTLLGDILNNIGKYQNSNLTLHLRLKNIDYVFNKIVFYDRKNYDIAFDIYDLKKKKEFRKDALNLKQGLEYKVKFTVIKIVPETKSVYGDLIDFKPVILDSLPFR